MTEASRRRLLLIEDDRDIARFVSLALEESPLELHQAASLAAARALLARLSFDLVITDLMLPDGTAEALLEEGWAGADGAPPWLVYSAGLDPAREARLRRLGAARLLHKPIPLSLLLATVSDCLERRAAGASPAAAPLDAPAAPPAGDSAAQAAAIGEHFGGDGALFEAFKAGCLVRFADDRVQGQAACAAHDAVRLRQLCHSLKSVLQLLGQPELAAGAAALEQACAAVPAAEAWPALKANWMALSGALARLRPG